MALTQEQFEVKANVKHNNYYDYSLSRYTRGKDKIEIVCPEHGVFTQVAESHLSGRGCYLCRNRKIADSKRDTLETFIEKVSIKHGDKYDIPKQEYVNSQTKVIVICQDHGEFETLPASLIAGHGCPDCGFDRMARSHFVSFTEFLEKANRKRFTYSNYKGMSKPVKILCKKHLVGFSTIASKHLKQSTGGCPMCHRELMSKVMSKSVDVFRSEVCNLPYEIDFDSYVHSKIPIRVTCNKVYKTTGEIHGEFFIRPNDLLNGHGCPKCASNGIGRAESEVRAFIESLGFKTDKGCSRTLGCNIELDIIIPEKDIAIEYNGLYWHSEKFRDSKFHLNKTEDAKALGYRLIHIFEDEWLQKQSQVKSRLCSILGISKSRIYARSTELTAISWPEASEFLERHHLQGAGVPGKFRYGLFEGAKLRAVMTFGTARFGGEDYELLRFASDGSVIGGFSKLLKAFTKTLPAGKVIVSYADRRWSEGDVYGKCGFEFSGFSDPGYSWTKSQNRLNRQMFMKHRLHKVLPKYDPEKTEVANMHAAEYYRIYDCGVSKWLKTT